VFLDLGTFGLRSSETLDPVLLLSANNELISDIIAQNTLQSNSRPFWNVNKQETFLKKIQARFAKI